MPASLLCWNSHIPTQPLNTLLLLSVPLLCAFPSTLGLWRKSGCLLLTFRIWSKKGKENKSFLSFYFMDISYLPGFLALKFTELPWFLKMHILPLILQTVELTSWRSQGPETKLVEDRFAWKSVWLRSPSLFRVNIYSWVLWGVLVLFFCFSKIFKMNSLIAKGRKWAIFLCPFPAYSSSTILPGTVSMFDLLTIIYLAPSTYLYDANYTDKRWSSLAPSATEGGVVYRSVYRPWGHGHWFKFLTFLPSTKCIWAIFNLSEPWYPVP